MSSKRLNLEDSFLAYDGVNNEYEFFSTLKDAEEYLEEIFLDEEEGYHPDMSSCKIYKLYETTEYEVIDSKENYKYESEADISEDVEESEVWPYDNAFEEMWKHKFVKIKDK